MNIFALSELPIVAAREMCDKHIVKMPIETAQMLSTVHRMLDGTAYVDYSKNGRRIQRWSHPTDSPNGDVLYRATMMNHPCTVWARETLGNYLWLAKHGMGLCEEYTRRYGRVHGSQRVLEWCYQNIPSNIDSSIVVTPFAQAMPNNLKVPNDAVAAYRQYYIVEKSRFATWKAPAEMPDWFFSGISSSELTNDPMNV